MTLSVCLASYNGERFIREQIASILDQLPHDGELIVSDDASTDSTVGIVRAFEDQRVRLFAHATNVHYVANFERAIAEARGEIVFLSDQDDVWSANKVATVCAAFDRHPQASMVVHALAHMDEAGQLLAAPPSGLWPHGSGGSRGRASFMARQLVKGQVFGCTTAFRRVVAQRMLPFPARTYAHDHWLSVVAPTVGPIVLLDEALVRYRHHGTNVSPRTSLRLRGQIAFRLRLARLAAIALGRAARPDRR